VLRQIVLISIIFLTGCAAKKPLKSTAPTTVGIPISCIVGATPKAACKQISPDLAECDHVIVKFVCVQVKK
jgi:hypothetical protein